MNFNLNYFRSIEYFKQMDFGSNDIQQIDCDCPNKLSHHHACFNNPAILYKYKNKPNINLSPVCVK